MSNQLRIPAETQGSASEPHEPSSCSSSSASSSDCLHSERALLPLKGRSPSPLRRLRTEPRRGPEAGTIMAELDIPQMKREVESLQYQLAINREKSSITVTELVKWIEGCVCEDPFLNPELMRANPWVEKGKCVIL
uniref:Guanine nucleotide binding protein (G protein), gamma 13a n=2 Tax=Kryptolebias marmoratus TaxID=37003 RepID=A0A3Q3A0J1_KRYMA